MIMTFKVFNIAKRSQPQRLEIPKKPLTDLKPLKQTGTVKEAERDIKRIALPPGKRVSKSGKTYYEYRVNRSDAPGKNI